MKTCSKIANSKRSVFDPARLGFITAILLLCSFTNEKNGTEMRSVQKMTERSPYPPATADSLPSLPKNGQPALGVQQVNSSNLVAIGMDSVIQLYAVDKTNGNKPVLVQELYRGRGLKVQLVHEKATDQLKLHTAETLTTIAILDANGDTVYENTGSLLNPVISIASLQKGNYTLLASGQHGKSRQFFFSR
ncbi:MAG TPA: hypothetical protein VFV31_10800 [Chitinophagaceae bacterium]|nr:hypothetical protein [Chitinophagaceae bacterium]